MYAMASAKDQEKIGIRPLITHSSSSSSSSERVKVVRFHHTESDCDVTTPAWILRNSPKNVSRPSLEFRAYILVWQALGPESELMD